MDGRSGRIRSRERTRNVRKADRSAGPAGSLKKTAVRTRERIADFTDDGVVTPEEYAETKFFQGFAQYYSKAFINCYKNVSMALAGGYTDNNAAEYKSSALANIIQDRVDNKDYDGAYKFIDEAIETDPSSSLLYDMKGFVVEQDKGTNDALPVYQKAVDLDPNNADANYNLGRMYYNLANDLILSNPEATTQQMVPKLQPLYEKALPFLKKAAELDENKASQVKYMVDDIDYKYEQMGLKK